MSHVTVSSLLRFALRLDAVATFATGTALAGLAARLEPLLALPQPLLFGAGVFCLGYAAVVAWMGARAQLPRWSVWTIIVGNAIWATECLIVGFGETFAPTAFGIAFLALQAVAVYGFAGLQFAGLRRGDGGAMAVA